MTDIKKIALVFPSYQEYEDIISVKENQRHIGKIPPLSLCYVAAVLKQHNYDVKIIDASVHNYGLSEVLQELTEYKPDYIGFTSTTYQFYSTLLWITEIKKVLTDTPIILGGIHTTLYPEETLFHKPIDYILRGDAEESLPLLLKALENESPLDNIAGLGYKKKDGQIFLNDKIAYISDINKTPVPARELIPTELYYSLISKKKNFTVMMASRGCPCSCVFCDNNTIKFRTRTNDNIMAEIKECYERYGVREIDFFDAIFTIDKKKTIDLANRIKESGMDIIWSARTRLDMVDEDILKAISEAGCYRLLYGIESGSPTILKNIKKDITIEKIKESLQLTEKYDIESLGFFMIGNIGENKQTIKQTNALIRKLPLTYIQVTGIYAPPNTELYMQIADHYKRDFWREYTKAGIKGDRIPLYKTVLTEKQINKYVQRTYLSFYLHPKRIWRIIKTIKSYAEVKRSFIALKDMIHSYIVDLLKNKG